jgi:hypothetical protein
MFSSFISSIFVVFNKSQSYILKSALVIKQMRFQSSRIALPTVHALRLVNLNYIIHDNQ